MTRKKELDPVDEIRQIRERHAKEFDYDLEAIFDDLKKKEKKSGWKVVSFPPKRLKKNGRIDESAGF